MHPQIQACMPACMNTYAHAYMQVCIQANKQACINVRMCMYINANIHAHANMQEHAKTIFVYVSIHACKHTPTGRQETYN